MFDIIKSYISNEEFYIIILKNGVYLKNYNKIIGIDDDEVIIEIDNHIYKIKGHGFILTKTIGKELSIKGYVESVNRL